VYILYIIYLGYLWSISFNERLSRNESSWNRKGMFGMLIVFTEVLDMILNLEKPFSEYVVIKYSTGW